MSDAENDKGLFEVGGDRVLWFLVFVLSCISVLAVFSSVYSLAYRFYGANPVPPLIKHCFILLFGGIISVYISGISLRWLVNLSPLFMVVSLVLLLILFIEGMKGGRTVRWLKIPIIDMSFQPSEILRISMILFMAFLYAKFGDKVVKVPKYLLRVCLLILPFILLIFPFNLSTAVIVAVLFIFLLYFMGMPWKYIIGGVVALSLVFGIMIGLGYLFPDTFVRFTTWRNRILSHISGDDMSFQANMSISAIGSGGILGKGPGNSTYRFYLPQAYSDFIFAIISEEYGIIGGILLIFIFVMFCLRGYKIAYKSLSPEVMLIAAGISTNIMLQAAVHIGVNVGILPVTGQPLPFISLGGTSLLINFVSVGILQSAYNSIYKRE